VTRAERIELLLFEYSVV